MPDRTDREQILHLVHAVDDMKHQNEALEKKFDAFAVRSEPMLRTYENIGWMKKTVISVVIFISVVCGIIVAIKNFWK